MKLDSLRHLGLTNGEITIFNSLLNDGPQPVTDLITHTKLKKGDCYNKLADLKSKHLIEEFDQDKKRHYRLANPNKLEELANNQYQEATVAKRELEGLLPEILSNYTLTYKQPGIVSLEGREAMIRVLDDSLTATGPILQYVDLDAVYGIHPDLNRLYARRRKRLQVKKQIIVSDNPKSREYTASADPEVTEVRLTDYQLPPFASAMMIYNQKVSYLTLKPDTIIGVIIEDPFISQMHRALFQMNWAAAHTLPTPESNHPTAAPQTAGS